MTRIMRTPRLGQHWLDTVVYFLRLLKPWVHWMSQRQWTSTSRNRYPDNKHINKHNRGGVSKTRIFYQSPNISRSTSVKSRHFHVIYIQLERARLVWENYYPVQGCYPTCTFFGNWSQRCIAYLNHTPKFNYSTLLCCQIREILSIYTPTMELDKFAKMIILVRVGTPHRGFFQKLNAVVHDRPKPYTKIHNSTLIWC